MRSLIDGLKLHAHAIKAGFTSTIYTCNQLINSYSRNGFMQGVHKLFDEMPERNVFTWNAIIWAHIKSQNLTQAQHMFDSAPHRDSVTYNSMLSGYVSADGYASHALKLFLEMQSRRDETRIDEVTLTTMLHLTAKLGVLSYGRQLHSFMVKTGNNWSKFAVSALIDMYSKCQCFQEACLAYNGCGGGVVDLVSKNAMVAACCRDGDLEKAQNVFWSESELNDTVSWNTMISGYAQNGYEEEALKLFCHMAEDGVRWNEHTFAIVLSACASIRCLGIGKEVHAWVLKHGLDSNPFISSGIVDLYCKCGKMRNAESVHAAIGIMQNSFSITSMIVGYSFQANMVEARRLFDSLAEKNHVVWTAMFSGYTKSQQCEAIFELFDEFKTKDATVTDALILVSVLGACAIQASIDPGKQIHAYILRMGIEMNEKLINAVVDMYSKCGNIVYAQRIFKRVGAYRDAILYNVMIAGYAHHGCEKEAILLFEEMLDSGIRPDAVTFVALLSVCRHSGLVELGEKYFHSMTNYHGISPEIDHYACMIDLYGRANQLEKAAAFMKDIPIELDAVILGTFLNACKINSNVELAREAEEKLLRIEGDNGARYVQLANVYAADGKWIDMGRIRKKMRGKEVKKHAGCSWVNVGNRVHIFTSGDRSHSETESIYCILVGLTAELNYVEQIETRAKANLMSIC
ncbi:putative pentatricopeptide repeat-containing protein At3g18840 [Cornus florida]|uniref:putative pentatricopeptide repeat-containing protein At3g18840 n=1 Tax=Cornus florida TaxID=4283 RepID=UPI00289F8639|nr:putative pentatricopeptide repeat-containing protein At3g18840 [Cornus florida]